MNKSCPASASSPTRGDENVGADFASFVRTIVILIALGGMLAGTGQWQPFGSVSARSYVFLILSGLATGASWVCYFRALKLGDAARVAPIDKLSVVLVAVLGVGCGREPPPMVIDLVFEPGKALRVSPRLAFQHD